MLVVTDYTADVILVYEQKYLRQPQIDLVEPRFAQPGESILVKGVGLSEVSGVWIGDVPQVYQAEEGGSEINIQLSDGTLGGRVRVKTLAGEAESETNYGCQEG